MAEVASAAEGLADRGSGRCRRRRTQQRLVLREDGGLEPAELDARFDAELLDEVVAGPLEGPQRLGLLARSVERTHQLAPSSLAQWLRRDQRLELGCKTLVLAQRQLGVDEVLDRDTMQLLEPGAQSRRTLGVRHVSERGARPELERCPERVRRQRGGHPDSLLASASSASKRSASTSSRSTSSW